MLQLEVLADWAKNVTREHIEELERELGRKASTSSNEEFQSQNIDPLSTARLRKNSSIRLDIS